VNDGRVRGSGIKGEAIRNEDKNDNNTKDRRVLMVIITALNGPG
jgi:hypothetical protein